MSRMAKGILALTLVLVFAAGAVVGMVRQRVAVGGHGPGQRGGSFLTKELGLTPEQQEKMRRIWSEQGPASGRDREHWEKRREYQRQRDEAVRALLTDEQRAKYDAIQKEYGDRMAELGRERQAAFQQAVERTKAILTPEQVTKYEAFLKRRSDGGGGPPPSWHDRHGGGGRSPATTRPATRS